MKVEARSSSSGFANKLVFNPGTHILDLVPSSACFVEEVTDCIVLNAEDEVVVVVGGSVGGVDDKEAVVAVSCCSVVIVDRVVVVVVVAGSDVIVEKVAVDVVFEDEMDVIGAVGA